MIRRRRGAVVLALVAVLLAGCSSLENWGDSVTRAFSGVSATMTTYSADGAMVDRIHGKSFRISRDERFDTTDDDGKSNEDSSVLLISLEDSHISHVGSTLLLVEDGILDVSDLIPAEARFENWESGTPWLNDLREKFRNSWNGRSKTIIVRSQQGYPIAVFIGNNVSMFDSDIPKSTTLLIDGKHMLIYRADYSIVDSNLLDRS